MRRIRIFLVLLVSLCLLSIPASATNVGATLDNHHPWVRINSGYFLGEISIEKQTGGYINIGFRTNEKYGGLYLGDYVTIVQGNKFYLQNESFLEADTVIVGYEIDYGLLSIQPELGIPPPENSESQGWDWTLRVSFMLDLNKILGPQSRDKPH